MGNVVVVIGGATEGGISHALVHRLVAGGDTVAVVDVDDAGARRTVEQVADQAGSASAFACDVTD
jgi:NAD(P)-dependent dehydrogenase (short-subunit alcohol dehydrogenase family)